MSENNDIAYIESLKMNFHDRSCIRIKKNTIITEYHYDFDGILYKTVKLNGE